MQSWIHNSQGTINRGQITELGPSDSHRMTCEWHMVDCQTILWWLLTMQCGSWHILIVINDFLWKVLFFGFLLVHLCLVPKVAPALVSFSAFNFVFLIRTGFYPTRSPPSIMSAWKICVTFLLIALSSLTAQAAPTFSQSLDVCSFNGVCFYLVSAYIANLSLFVTFSYFECVG